MSDTDKDFVLGEDVTHLFQARKGKGGIVVSARFQPDEAEALAHKAEAEHMTLSAYVRACVLRDLPEPTVWIRLDQGMTISQAQTGP